MSTPSDSVLAASLPPSRSIKSVYVGHWLDLPHSNAGVADAIAFVELYESKPVPSFARYEIGVRYTNGNEIRGQFIDKATALSFVRSLR